MNASRIARCRASVDRAGCNGRETRTSILCSCLAIRMKIPLLPDRSARSQGDVVDVLAVERVDRLDRGRDLVLALDPVQLGLGLADGVGAEQPGLVADRRRRGPCRGVAARARGRARSHRGFHMGRVTSACRKVAARRPTFGPVGVGRTDRPTIRYSRRPVELSSHSTRRAGRRRSRRSRLGDVGEPGDGDDLVAAEEDAGPVAADAEADRVVDVDLAGRRAVAEVVQVGVAESRKSRSRPTSVPRQT